MISWVTRASGDGRLFFWGKEYLPESVRIMPDGYRNQISPLTLYALRHRYNL